MLVRTDYLVDIDRETGELISGWPRIKQSLITILTTRLNTRWMRLWWGSEFLGIQDKPANFETFVEGINAAIDACNAYEPEFKITRLAITELGPTGSISIEVEGVDLVDMARRRISVTL